MTVPALAVLLVGGHGTRMAPLTTTRPKHLLPVAGVPLLDLVVDRLIDHGVTRLALATSVHADLVEDHLATRGPELAERGASWVVSREPRPLGTGGALVAAAHVLDLGPSDPLVVVNGDLLTAVDLRAQAELLDDGTDVVLHVRPAPDPAPFGTVRCSDDGVVHAFEEKVPGPAGTLVNAGTYLLHGRALGSLRPGEPSSWERDLLPALVADGSRVRARAQDTWFADIGSPEALVAASAEILAGEGGHALPASFDPRGRTDLRAGIAPDAQVGADVALQPGVRVSPGARVDRSVLLDRVDVGPGCVVRDSVVGADAVIGAGCVVEGSAIGDGARLPPGTHLIPGSRVEPHGGQR